MKAKYFNNSYWTILYLFKLIYFVAPPDIYEFKSHKQLSDTKKHLKMIIKVLNNIIKNIKVY